MAAGGKKVLDHATIARFRSLHFAPCVERILAEVCEFLYQMGELSGEVIFIAGTKIEACANKYTFVWKQEVSKNMEMLQKSIENLESYLNKLKEYTQKLHICGKRNSFSKTDHDATFMRMK